MDAGGVKVDSGLTEHIAHLLETSNDIDKEDIPWFLFDGLRDFRKFGKRKFSTATEPCDVRIGGRRDTFANPPIQKGVYTLMGYRTDFSRINNIAISLTQSFISHECERLFNLPVQLMVQAMQPYFNGRQNPTVRLLFTASVLSLDPLRVLLPSS